MGLLEVLIELQWSSWRGWVSSADEASDGRPEQAMYQLDLGVGLRDVCHASEVQSIGGRGVEEGTRSCG